MKIVTNNKSRKIFSWWDLSKKQQNLVKQEYSLTTDECFDVQFIFYKDNMYTLSEFTRVSGNPWVSMPPNSQIVTGGWHGFLSESYFSGVVIKIVDDDTVVIGQFFC